MTTLSHALNYLVRQFIHDQLEIRIGFHLMVIIQKDVQNNDEGLYGSF